MLKSHGEEEPGEGFTYGQSCRRLLLFTRGKHSPNEQRKALSIGKSPTEATRRARHEYEWERPSRSRGREPSFSGILHFSVRWCD